MNPLTPEEQKQEKRREAMRRHRAKLKALYGTTYVGQQKEAVLKYQQKVKNILKVFLLNSEVKHTYRFIKVKILFSFQDTSCLEMNHFLIRST